MNLLGKMQLCYLLTDVNPEFRTKTILLWILFLMVVTEKQAGERSAIMGFPFMEAPRDESENQWLVSLPFSPNIREDLAYPTENFRHTNSKPSPHLLLLKLPWFILPLYVDLPKFDIAIVACCGQDGSVWRKGSFTQALTQEQRRKVRLEPNSYSTLFNYETTDPPLHLLNSTWSCYPF